MKKNNYAGSIVLGLNDAIVELTGVLAGLTLALQNSSIIVISALITGIAASLSMAASSYLHAEEEKNHKEPFQSAIHTGITYLINVIFLIAPYFIFSNVYYALATTLIIAILIIAVYNYSISTQKQRKSIQMENT